MRATLSILLLASLLPGVVARGQQEHDIDAYEEFRLRLYSGIEMEGRDGYWNGRTFHGVVEAGYEVRLDANDIASLQVPGEGQAGTAAWMGAGVGAGVGGLMIVTAWEDRAEGRVPFESYDVHPGLVAVGLLAGGAMLGAVIGSLLPSWRDVDLGPMRTMIPFQEPVLPVNSVPCRKAE